MHQIRGPAVLNCLANANPAFDSDCQSEDWIRQNCSIRPPNTARNIEEEETGQFVPSGIYSENGVNSEARHLRPS
jgi:hypothetical protein